MKKLTYKKTQEIIKTDPVMQNIKTKTRKLSRDSLTLRNRRDSVIPNQLGQNEVKHFQLQKKWHARGIKLGLWDKSPPPWEVTIDT